MFARNFMAFSRQRGISIYIQRTIALMADIADEKTSIVL